MQLHSGHDRIVVPTASIPPYRRGWSFAFPDDVVEDPSLSFSQKRAVLAEWASDKSAVESRPTLRQLPGTTFPVTLASVMAARQRLDDLTGLESSEMPRLGHLARHSSLIRSITQ